MGFDLGLEKVGRFKLKACVELDAAACETMRQNQAAGRLDKSVLIVESDVRDVDPFELMEKLGLRPGELDLIVGGPPCQSFSTAGKRGTVQDPRGTLLWQFLEFVEKMQPKMFVMENVRGLISAALENRPVARRPPKGPPLTEKEQRGSVVKMFAKDLRGMSGASYHLDVFEVNSVNYGAPQIRERVLFFGNRFGREVDFPAPTHVSPLELEPTSVRQCQLFEPESAELLPWSTLQDAIGDLDERGQQELMDFSERKKSFLAKVPPGSNWRSLTEKDQRDSMKKAWEAKGGRSGWWRRLTFELPCPTLVTMPNHASTSLCHPVETRVLSVREYARIQGFPDEWQFHGKVSDKYKQIGNAVPVRLGEVAGEVVCEVLDRLKSENWLALEAPPEMRLVYLKSHIRTRKWFSNGEAVVWGKDADISATHKAMVTDKKITKL